jgi:hypothetical protein
MTKFNTSELILSVEYGLEPAIAIPVLGEVNGVPAFKALDFARLSAVGLKHGDTTLARVDLWKSELVTDLPQVDGDALKPPVFGDGLAYCVRRAFAWGGQALESALLFGIRKPQLFKVVVLPCFVP